MDGEPIRQRSSPCERKCLLLDPGTRGSRPIGHIGHVRTGCCCAVGIGTRSRDDTAIASGRVALGEPVRGDPSRGGVPGAVDDVRGRAPSLHGPVGHCAGEIVLICLISLGCYAMRLATSMFRYTDFFPILCNAILPNPLFPPLLFSFKTTFRCHIQHF